MKHCSKCGEAKPLALFYKNRNRPDGHTERCAACLKAYSKAYYDADPERSRRLNRDNYDKHREERIERGKRYRAANSDKMKSLYAVHNKKRYWADPERAKRKKREWNAANPERVKQYGRIKAAKRRALENKAAGSHTVNELRQLFDSYLGLCVYCNKPTRAKHSDHVTPITRGGCNHIENIAPACGYCNRSKGDRSLLQFLAARAGF